MLNLRNIQISHQIVHALFSDFRVYVCQKCLRVYITHQKD